MNCRIALLGLIGTGILSACQQGENATGVTISHVPISALTSAYVTDWAPLEAVASALLALPKYQIQKFDWSFSAPGSPIYSSNSLANGRVEYAHAAGLTGAGQIISVVDAGFLTSHDEFSGKSITTPAGFAPGIDDHGTMVAAVAAGVSTPGNTIGVAPGAALLLGDFLSEDLNPVFLQNSVIAANQQALSLGAIVQNNSWGVDIAANSANFQIEFGSTSSVYYRSILDLSKTAVIVFAASNDVGRTTSDLYAGLPLLAPELQNSWIAVINAVPTFSGSTISSATVISSKCLQAAAWCMAADGTVWGAVATGNSDYALGTGTSFAAPQISGSIALLAEAFPSLNAEELRARLLASADNNFFAHTGYVEFATGVQHGYSSTFGHGFLNMKAALSPIGGSYLPRSNGSSASFNSATLASGGMAGNSLSTRLAQYDLVIVDGLGTGFNTPASVLMTEAIEIYDPMATINSLFAVDLYSDAIDPFQSGFAFGEFGIGQELEFQGEDMRLALLVPVADAVAASYGVALSRDFDLGGGQLRLGLSAMVEGDGFVGMKSLLEGDSLSGTHGAASFEWAVPMAGKQEVRFSGRVGVAMPGGELSDMSMSPVQYNSLGVRYAAQDVWGGGDRLSLGLRLPNAVQSGSANVVLPVARSNGSVAFRSVDLALTPEARQLDISIDYGVPLSRSSQVIMGAVHRFNDGNVAGRSASEASIGLQFRF